MKIDKMLGFKTVISLRGLAIANILFLLYLILTQHKIDTTDCFLYKIYFCDNQSKTYFTNNWYPSELVGDNITGNVLLKFTLRFSVKGFLRLSYNKSFFIPAFYHLIK